MVLGRLWYALITEDLLRLDLAQSAMLGYSGRLSHRSTKSRRSLPQNISSSTKKVGAPKTPRATAPFGQRCELVASRLCIGGFEQTRAVEARARSDRREHL